MKKRINVGIVGAGLLGADLHAPQYLGIKDVKLLAICDVDEARAKVAGRKLGIAKVFKDYQNVVQMPELDVVDICVPTPWHHEIAIAAARAGKHVLCEKPIALELDKAEEMLKATRKAGVKFMVAHVVRFFPWYLMAKELIDSGELGRPLSASASRRIPYPNWGAWYKDPKISGGAVVDLHIHDLDYLNWIFGDPAWVFSQGIKSSLGAVDHVLTSIGYAKGGKAMAEASFLMPAGFPLTMRLSVLCEHGDIELKAEGYPQMEKSLTIYKPNKRPRSVRIPEKDGYAEEIRYFIDCVRHDKQPEMIPPESALLALKTALAARRSVEEEAPVTIS
jgi:UDP-N-acetylglucosamine 3-dehydrogenase